MANGRINPKRLPSQEVLLSLLRYEPGTGKLFWKERPREMFSSGRHGNGAWKAWNIRCAGKEAYTWDTRGYRRIKIADRLYRVHRVIWALVYGHWPIEVDHINGDPSDNRLVNLRAVTHAENGRNQKHRSTNTSGVMGVTWRPDNGKWRARINIRGSRKTLGTFADFDEAIAARKVAEAQYDYYWNHGRK